ncbi:arginine N-succinyltransferase [Maricaulaceae bacterium NA33B04]|nr:arginine N-succinyltransferase [Maricaulaceae bacterium NA33B04]
MLVMRAARAADTDCLLRLAEAAGPGFTSLALPDDALAEKLTKSEKAFNGELDHKFDCTYQLMLEDTESGKILGTSAVKAEVGVKKPYFDFKVFTIAQASQEADRRFDMDAMMLVNDFAGATEVGSLFVSDELRGRGAGKLASKSRYLLVATERERFGDRILSELRGVVDDKGDSIFFEHVTRPFFRMTFEEADRLSAATDNQFILDLMPQHLIYLDLLPQGVQDVIGKTHPHGANALRLLEAEGFKYHRYIDIFDGGPLVSCAVSDVATVKDSDVVALAGGNPGEGAVSGLVANERFGDFRCVQTEIELVEGGLRLSADAQRALDVTEGETLRYWTKD